MDCTLKAEDLPQVAKVRISLSGDHLQHLIDGRFKEAIVDDALPVILSYYKARRGQHRKFVFWIKPDIASRFAIIGQEEAWKK